MSDHGADAWNGAMGERWVRNADQMDLLMSSIADELMKLAALKPGERVLDIGCGNGVTTMMAAEAVGPSGAALGVDVSSPMTAHAAKRAGQAGSSAKFTTADASRWRSDDPFDIMVSRFGVMFFDDPTSAFANIRASLKPGGRTAFVCWREPRHNEMFALPQMLVQPFLKQALPPSDPDAPGPFAFADAGRLLGLLEASGWRQVDIQPLDVDMMLPGDNLVEQVDNLLDMGPVSQILVQQEIDRTPVAEAVRAHFADRVGADGRFQIQGGIWAVKADA